MLNLQNLIVYFTFTQHLNLEKPYFKCLIAINIMWPVANVLQNIYTTALDRSKNNSASILFEF